MTGSKLHRLVPSEVRGTMISILSYLELELNFTGRLVTRADMMWGSYDNRTDSWNGMMMSLLAGEVDVIFTSFSLSYIR